MEELINKYKKLLLIFIVVIIVAPIVIKYVIKNEIQNINETSAEPSQEEIIELIKQGEAIKKENEEKLIKEQLERSQEENPPQNASNF